MVECHLAKVKVAGPNPVSRSNGSNDSVSEIESLKIEQSIDGIRLHVVKCDAIADPRSGFAPKVVAKATTPSPAPTNSHERASPQSGVWHHSQEVRQGSAKSSPPVQVWVMPPKDSTSIEVLFLCGDGIRLHEVKSAECADTRWFVPQGRHQRWPHRLPLHTSAHIINTKTKTENI